MRLRDQVLNDTEWVAAVASRLLQARGSVRRNEWARRMGASPQAVGQWERGAIPASWMFLRRLREAGVDLNEMMAGEAGRITMAEAGRAFARSGAAAAGGRARASKLTPEERRAIAARAGRARWGRRGDE